MSVQTSGDMVIEWLKFRVAEDLREQFVQRDDEIWTPVLASSPGFLGKEVWISPDHLSEVIILVRWASMEAWDAVPADQLQQTEARFQAAMNGAAEIIESGRYQIRKFVSL